MSFKSKHFACGSRYIKTTKLTFYF